MISFFPSFRPIPATEPAHSDPGPVAVIPCILPSASRALLYVRLCTSPCAWQVPSATGRSMSWRIKDSTRRSRRWWGSDQTLAGLVALSRCDQLHGAISFTVRSASRCDQTSRCDQLHGAISFTVRSTAASSSRRPSDQGVREHPGRSRGPVPGSPKDQHGQLRRGRGALPDVPRRPRAGKR